MARDDVSTRFPFINLEKALSRAAQLFNGDKSGKPMPVSVAFELWGYAPKSSGAFQTVGALKGYGLIEDEGSNAERRIRLSDAARRYFLDERDDIRAGMLSEFALNPPLFRALWNTDKWSEGIPADTVARSHLKIERHLNDQSARSLLGILKENIVFAGLKGVRAEETAQVPPAPEGELKGPPEPDKAPTSHFGRGVGTGESIPAASSVHRSPPDYSKPIIFDMESVTVSGRFDNAEDLQDFIDKLMKLKPLLPSKVGQ